MKIVCAILFIGVLVTLFLRVPEIWSGEAGDESVQDEMILTSSQRMADGKNGIRSLEELEAIMLAAENSWYANQIPAREFSVLRWQVISSWPVEEVKLLCQNQQGADWLEALFQRWGMAGDGEALGFVLELRDHYELQYQSALEKEGVTRETEIVGFYLEETGLYLNAVLAGWSQVDARAAWEAVTAEGGEVTRSESFYSDYGYLVPIPIFEQLAKIDPEYAFSEFQNYPRAEFRGSILKGMARGLPDRHDWKTLLEAIIASPGLEDRDIKAVTRGSLLGRWMSEDYAAAEDWFRSEVGLAISREVTTENESSGGDPDPFLATSRPVIVKTVVRDVSLAPAVRHWLVRDFVNATVWLKERPEVVSEIVAETNWLDPDQLSGKELREVIAICLEKEERGDLLMRYLKQDEYVEDPLEYLVPSHEKNGIKAEIEELQVDEQLGGQIFKVLWDRRHWAESDEANDPDPDPFTSE